MYRPCSSIDRLRTEEDERSRFLRVSLLEQVSLDQLRRCPDHKHWFRSSRQQSTLQLYQSLASADSLTIAKRPPQKGQPKYRYCSPLRKSAPYRARLLPCTRRS